MDAEATNFAGIGSWLESYIFRFYLWVAANRWPAPIDSFELFQIPARHMIEVPQASQAHQKAPLPPGGVFTMYAAVAAGP